MPPNAGQPRNGAAASLVRLVVVGYLPMLRALALPLSLGAGAIVLEDEGKSPDDASLWLYLAVAMTLVLLGGLFAGLTIALMGQDEINLAVIESSGDGNDKKYAGKVLNLLMKGKHWVLVTLLLSNVITNETLPIVLDRALGGGWPAVVGSTTLIVIFGEVIPQSICVRYGLVIGSYLSPVVLGLMWIMSPIAWPTAKLLDYLLGEDHGTTYKKTGLKTLITLHKSMGSVPTERLNEDEVTIITAVLDLKAKSVASIMTPMKDVHTLSSETVLDEETVAEILKAGYSRIPIYNPESKTDFIGMLLVRTLITYDPEDGTKVCEMALATLPETEPETSCLDIINFFQEGHSHMVIVSETPGEKTGALGVVTLEDVIEELIGEEIMDESDPRPNENESQVFAPPRRTATALRSRTFSRQNTGLQNHHFEPSNLASKPATTRYNAIKIKPGRAHNHDASAGLVTVADVQLDGDAPEERSYASVVQSGVNEAREDTPLLGDSNGK